MSIGGKAVIRLTKSGGLSSYAGSTRNGVTSSSYGSWSGSYTMTFVKSCPATTTPPTTTTPTTTPPTTTPAACSTYTTAPGNAQSLSHGSYTYAVTGSSSGTIWGTGTYTDDSPIAKAAVHAGHVSVGGKVVIQLTKSGGLSSYAGSTRNGVTSSSYGSWSGSYTMTFVKSCSTLTAPPTTTPPVTPPPPVTPTPAVDTGIPMKGFDFDYKIYGKPGSNDLYVVRDSAAAGIPGVTGFYLRENTDTDEPQFYNLEHPVSRTSAARDGFTHNTNYDMKLKDINSDGAQDLIITGLEDSTLGRWNMIVYASTSANESPIGYREIDRDFKDFFSELGAWIEDGDYFDDNAGVLVTVLKIIGYSFGQHSNGNVYFGSSPMPVNRRPSVCFNLWVYCVDVYADSDFVNSPNILYSLTPNAAFVRDEEDDPNLKNGYLLVAVFFSLTQTFDIPDYSGFTPAYAISPAIQSVMDTGELIAGSAVEKKISSILTVVFGGVGVIPATVTGSTADEQGESRAEILWWLLANWLTQSQMSEVTEDVRGNPSLDAFMVRELELLQTQGRLAAGNNEWVFVADMVNGSLTKKNLRQGSNDYEATPSFAGVVDLQAVGHSHPVANVSTFPADERAFVGDFLTACRELPGPGDHNIPLSHLKVPNYIITPSGAIRVLEIVNQRVVVRTVSGTDYPGQTILTSSYPQLEATGKIGKGAVRIPQQVYFVHESVPPCNHGRYPIAK